jgi:hypothetical protein
LFGAPFFLCVNALDLNAKRREAQQKKDSPCGVEFNGLFLLRVLCSTSKKERQTALLWVVFTGGQRS